MATQKQIEANRRNAQRSTGPKTAAGKKTSSRNSFKHGLSLALLPDNEARDRIEMMVRHAADPNASHECLEAATDFAIAYHEVGRVREVQTEILSEVNLAKATPEQLNEIIAIGRYDTRAQRKQRRASAKLRRLLAT